MGMFDSFISSLPVICPNCNQEIKDKELQSKELKCMLNVYRQGEPFEIKGPEIKLSIKDGWIEAHTVCDKCKEYIQFKILIENGVWTRTEKWQEP